MFPDAPKRQLGVDDAGHSVRSASSRKAAKELSSVTLSAGPTAPCPTSAAARRASSASRSPIATRQPAPAQARAVARLIPRAAPVMATTRPSRLRG